MNWRDDEINEESEVNEKCTNEWMKCLHLWDRTKNYEPVKKEWCYVKLKKIYMKRR